MEINEIVNHFLKNAPLEKDLSTKKLFEKFVKDLRDEQWPNRKNENWKYISTKSLREAWSVQKPSVITPNIYETDSSYLVLFEKGRSKKTAQNLPFRVVEGAEISSFNELQSPFRQQTDQFSLKLKHLSHFNNFTFQIPERVALKKPIYIKQVDNSIPLLTLSIQVASQSKADFFIEQCSQDNGMVGATYFLDLKADAQVNWFFRAHCDKGSFILNDLQVKQSEASVLKSLYSFSCDQGTIRNQSCFDLIGEGSQLDTNGVYFSNNQGQIDNQSIIQHRAPRCFSGQLFKGIVNNKSKTVFNGIVRIENDCEEAKSEQLHKSMMLDERSEVNVKPQLEIFHDDVKAAHGSTVGQMELEELFYLQSRGISKDEAIAMLLKGFVKEPVLSLEDRFLQMLMQEDLIDHGFL